MVKYSVLTGAEMSSLKQLIDGSDVAQVNPRHLMNLRRIGFTEMKRGNAVVTEAGRKEARAFTRSPLAIST
jgi:hypothetical protein